MSWLEEVAAAAGLVCRMEGEAAGTVVECRRVWSRRLALVRVGCAREVATGSANRCFTAPKRTQEVVGHAGMWHSVVRPAARRTVWHPAPGPADWATAWQMAGHLPCDGRHTVTVFGDCAGLSTASWSLQPSSTDRATRGPGGLGGWYRMLVFHAALRSGGTCCAGGTISCQPWATWFF